MIDKDKVYGVLTLFEPRGEEVIKNISTYVKNLDILYIYDNSEKQPLSQHLISLLPTNVKYISFSSNHGLSTPFNLAAKSVVNHGAEWLLTMDQDSYLEGNLTQLIQSATLSKSKIACATRDPGLKTPRLKKTAISSGMLISREVFLKIGFFHPDFFIDYIDDEFCFRARINDFAIIESPYPKLIHQVGEPLRKNLLLFNITVTNHNPKRRYFITRNRLSFIKKNLLTHPVFCSIELIRLIREILKILIFEKNRTKNFKYIKKGVFASLKDPKVWSNKPHL